MKTENPHMLTAVMRRVAELMLHYKQDLPSAILQTAIEMEEYYMYNIGQPVRNFSLPYKKEDVHESAN